MRPGILEDRRRFRYYRIPMNRRFKLIDKIRDIISSNQNVKLAVVYGSFLDQDLFRDVDIAVYTGLRVAPGEAYFFQDELSKKIGEEVGVKVDVRLIDYAPPWFKLKALSGLLLLEREYGLRSRLKFKASQELRDLEIKRGFRNVHNRKA